MGAAVVAVCSRALAAESELESLIAASDVQQEAASDVQQEEMEA